MRKFYRIMLGMQSMYAEECISDRYVSAGYGEDENPTPQFSYDWREFNKALIPVYLRGNPGKREDLLQGPGIFPRCK